jgi:hypothetical protein
MGPYTVAEKIIEIEKAVLKKSAKKSVFSVLEDL